ncbi:hypothetical protein, partial [Acinetobacter baumannii]|uniref:hypothetical protein n=1 Tax=Acinetobacter baumannii TaxID=470 RepID=UPI00209094AE
LARLREIGMGALIAVAQGSAREPRVVVMRWNGGTPGEAPVALLPLLRELAGSCGLSADVEYFENAFALLEDWHAQGILMGEGALE